jgi:hypothetical protein
MGWEQDDAIVLKADWLIELSERARAQGNAERADRLLLLAWQAYDGQDISIEAIHEEVVARAPPADSIALTSGFRSRRATR